MRNNVSYPPEGLVYPGEYTPLLEAEAMLEEYKLYPDSSTSHLLMNMDEYKECFRIEVVVPGAKREEILMHIHENVLSIVILHKKCKGPRKKLKIHEFDIASIERHILLPDNADTEFISAEYSQGILRMHMPKTKVPSKKDNGHIVVY